jgi:hypothetical protein
MNYVDAVFVRYILMIVRLGLVNCLGIKRSFKRTLHTTTILIKNLLIMTLHTTLINITYMFLFTVISKAFYRYSELYVWSFLSKMSYM